MKRIGKYNVRVVTQGETYGRLDCLTHNEPGPLVEFYDSRYMSGPEFEKRGQFVSRYYLDTLTEDSAQLKERGLCLDGGNRDVWSVTADEMAQVFAYISPRLIVEICPREPRAGACLFDGREVQEDSEALEALEACEASGDCEPACRHVLEYIGVQFRIVAKNAAGDYENRLATQEEKEETCRAIYFESETDFARPGWADIYLVWQAASESRD